MIVLTVSVSFVLSFEVEDYHQQLILSEKEMDNCRTRDELTGTRSSAAPLHSHKSAVTPPCKPMTPHSLQVLILLTFYACIYLPMFAMTYSY